METDRSEKQNSSHELEGEWKKCSHTRIAVNICDKYESERENCNVAVEEEEEQKDAQRGARTHDIEIKSLTLYRLS